VTSEDTAVCGSDNTTYASQCQLRVASCTERRRIRVRWQGSCGMSVSVLVTIPYFLTCNARQTLGLITNSGIESTLSLQSIVLRSARQCKLRSGPPLNCSSLDIIGL